MSWGQHFACRPFGAGGLYNVGALFLAAYGLQTCPQRYCNAHDHCQLALSQDSGAQKNLYEVRSHIPLLEWRYLYNAT